MMRKKLIRKCLSMNGDKGRSDFIGDEEIM